MAAGGGGAHLSVEPPWGARASSRLWRSAMPAVISPDSPRSQFCSSPSSSRSSMLSSSWCSFSSSLKTSLANFSSQLLA